MRVSFNLYNINNLCLLINKQEPFFGYLLSGIKIKIGKYKEFEYMACDSSCIYIQEEFIEYVQQDSSKLKEFISILLHEIYHIFLHHSWRYGFSNTALYSQYKNKPWLASLINIVLDAIINTNLVKSGYSFGSLKYVSLSSILPSDHPRINDNTWTEDELLLFVLDNSKKEGSKIQLPNGNFIEESSIEKDILFSNESSQAEKDIQKVESIKEISLKAAKSFKESGKNPGKLGSKIIPQEIITNKENNIPWEVRLKELAANAISNKYVTNYNQVIEHNFYAFELGINPFNKCPIEYPYKPLPQPNTVAVYIDLSGSIFCCPETLGSFLNEINEIAKYVGNLLLVTFDCGMTGCYLFDMEQIEEPLGDLLKREKDKYLVGGGGTDVIPLFKEFFNSFVNYNIDINIDNICMLIVLTDLWMSKVPLSLEPINTNGIIPTVWVVPEDACKDDLNFGEVLEIK